MSQVLNDLLALANEEAETSGIDMNEAVRGGGGARLLPAGYAFAQLIEYVELGNQPQEFGGKPKDPAMEFQVAFALTGHAPNPDPNGQPIPYANEDGTPYIMRPFPMALSQNEKAKSFLLFKKLNWRGTAKNFGQLLGQKYLIKVVHTAKSKTDATIVSRLDLAQILPPLDPVSQQPYPIADTDPSLFRLFLWNKPTKAGFDALKIEGTWEAKDGKPAESKNKIQEKMLGALNFQGSPLQQLLQGPALALPGATTPSQSVVPAQPSAPVVAAPVASPAAPAVAAPAIPTAVAPVVPGVPVASSVPVVGVTPPSVTGTATVAVPSVPATPVLPV